MRPQLHILKRGKFMVGYGEGVMGIAYAVGCGGSNITGYGLGNGFVGV